jgi:hypothetical protein
MGSTKPGSVPPRHCERHGPAEEIVVLPDELGALLGDILDALSSEELGRLPEPIWALLDFIAGTCYRCATVKRRVALDGGEAVTRQLRRVLVRAERRPG